MAHSNPAFSLAISDEKEYFFRICNLLVDGGTKIMKLEFDKIHPPNTLATVMQNERHTLHGLVGRRILTQKMWNELFPTVNASVDSNNFDITLLSVLFRNICGLTPPPSSSVHNYWDTYPQQNDITLQADLVRLKLLRNEIVAHASTTSISKAEFEKLWKDISSILLRRGGPSWKQEINQLLKTPFTNFGKSCLEQLKAWDENDKDLLEITLATSQKVDVIKSDMELIKSVIEKGQQNKPGKHMR